MAVAMIDTAKRVDDLEAVKIPREQARAIVDLVRSSHEAADVATKGDLAAVEQKLDGKIELLRKDMDGMKKDIIIWLGGLVVGSFVVLGGMLIKLMP